MKNMKRLVLLIVCTVLFGYALYAQGVKTINDIKRSGDYVYSEVTMATVEEAFDAACQILTVHVRDYAKDHKLSAKENITQRDVEKICDTIQVRRSDMYKVFAYIRKTDLEGGQVAARVEQKVTEKQSEAAIKKEVNTPVKEHEQEPARIVEEPRMEHSSASVTQASESVAASSGGLKLAEAWKQNVIDKLLSCSTFAEARAELVRMKQEYKVKRYGRPAECKDARRAFWLIGDSVGNVVTVLGPEDGGRTDFKTFNKTSLEAYSGYDAIWFILSK